MRRSEGFRIKVKYNKYFRLWTVVDQWNYVPDKSGWSRVMFTDERWEVALDYAHALSRNDTKKMYEVRLKASTLCGGF